MRAKQQNQKDEVKHPKEGTPPSIWVLYALIALSVIVYALYGNAIFGALAFVLIVVTLVAEFRGSVKQGGMKNSVYEIVTALVGVAVLWLILSIVLSTTSPLNVVASCSMLPSMHRGDLVILHGISNMSLFLQSKHVPTVNVSPDVLSSTFSNMNSEFLAYYFYSPSNPSDLAEITNYSSLPMGLYNSICLARYAQLAEYKNYRLCAVNQTKQQSNLVQYLASSSKILINGSQSNIATTSSLIIANHTITENYSNPIIVYQTTPNDSFSGDIIHRLYAAIKSGNNYYLLTKGDNNPGIDMEFGNYPISQDNVVGYVIADIPILGYLKLILTGQIASPSGCNYVILR